MHASREGHITCGRDPLLQVSGQPILVFFGHRPVTRVTRVVVYQHGTGKLNLRVRLLYSRQSHSPVSDMLHSRSV